MKTKNDHLRSGRRNQSGAVMKQREPAKKPGPLTKPKETTAITGAKARFEGPITRKTPDTIKIERPIAFRRPVAQRSTPVTPRTPAGVAPQFATTTAEAAGADSRLAFHPMADIFPVLDDASLLALANDIDVRGLLDEIMLLDGKILDGRCRYLACLRVGVAPKFENYAGEDPLGFVISRNVHRRHLTKIQRVFAAARAATLPVGSNQTTPGVPIGRAAKIFEVSQRDIARAKAILRQGTPDLVRAVESGKIAISRAARLCELAQEKQIAGVKEVSERKRNPQKKKEPTAVVNENTGGARPPERPPGADRNQSGNPEIPDRPDATGVVRENETAYATLIAAWSHASNSVRLRFIEKLIEEPELKPGAIK